MVNGEVRDLRDFVPSDIVKELMKNSDTATAKEISDLEIAITKLITEVTKSPNNGDIGRIVEEIKCKVLSLDTTTSSTSKELADFKTAVTKLVDDVSSLPIKDVDAATKEIKGKVDITDKATTAIVKELSDFKIAVTKLVEDVSCLPIKDVHSITNEMKTKISEMEKTTKEIVTSNELLMAKIKWAGYVSGIATAIAAAVISLVLTYTTPKPKEDVGLSKQVSDMKDSNDKVLKDLLEEIKKMKSK
jgi:hypothetical protein